MQLFVKGLAGCTSVLCIEGSDTVAALKSHAQATHGVPVCEQLLTANGRILLDAETLAASGLQADSTVHVLLRLCGGKGGFGALLRGQGRDGKITDNFDACRDLSGRRIRHVEAEKKLKDWQKESKERELEQLALKHMKEMAQQAKRDRDFKVNVEEVKRQHKEAADAVVEAVHTALAEGLQQHTGTANGKNKPLIGAAGSSAAAAAAAPDDAEAEAAAAGSSPGAKRKAGDGAAAAAGAGAGANSSSSGPAKKRKMTMLDMVEGGASDDDSSDDDLEDEA